MSDGFSDRFLSAEELERKLGMHRTTIYRAVKAGTFPPGRQLGPQTVRWLESEIDAWMRSRPAATSAEGKAA